MRVFASLFAIVSAAGVSLAQNYTTAPNANDTVAAGGSLNTLVRDQGFPRTYQVQIAASELAMIPPGSQITGVQWRQYSAASSATSWPPTDATWAVYDVICAQAANPINAMSTTFAANMVNPVTVRSGPFTIGANSYPGGVTAPPAVNGWGPICNFQTPYVYQGGDLVIYVAHQGSNITTNRFLDTLTTAGPGYGTLVRAVSATSYAPATGTAAGYTIFRLEWSAGGGTTNPSGSGSVSPACIETSTGGAAHLRVNVFPGANPPSTNITVVADGTNIGLGSSLTLFDDGLHNDGAAGDNEFGLDVTIPAGLTAGAASIPFIVADAEARSSNGAMNANMAGFGPGEGIASASEPTGSGDLTSITYAHNGNTAHMFKIAICDPANFSATTFGGTTFDTQLFLFRPDGTGITHNDDVPTGFPGDATLQSLITSNNTASLSPGIYYLAVSSYNRDPIAFACNTASLMWINTPFDIDRVPDGPNAADPVGGWTGTAVAVGNVTVTLTGAKYAAEGCAPPCDGDVNCDFALDGFDVEVQEKAVGGDTTDYCQPDPDFNGDFALDGFDVEAVEIVVGGGPCP